MPSRESGAVGARTFLISIQPRFVALILEGRKRFELRRFVPRFRAGDRALIYASTPTRAVVGTFRVGQVAAGAPREVWEAIGGPASGLSEQGFFAYLGDVTRCAAIEVLEPRPLAPPLTLSFRPPQSYFYLDAANAEHATLLRQAIPG